MYPFYVLDLPEDTTDADVLARYHELLTRHPPDRAPERFRILRAAYEALRSERDRVRTRLFYLDRSGAALATDLPHWLDGRPARRMSEDELAAFLRGAED